MKKDLFPFLEKVITAEEGRELEKEAIQEGCLEESFMEEAAKQVFQKVEAFLQKTKEKKLFFLLGKGNNGGDGYAVASLFLEKGYEIMAYSPFSLDQLTPLAQKKRKAFEAQGGRVFSPAAEKLFGEKGVIIDALLGTGFKGSLQEPLKDLVEKANESNLPIFAIDIPSGLDADTGEIKTLCIESISTIALGFYKTGYFLEKGWNVVGKIEKVSFGLPAFKEKKAKASFFFLRQEKLAALLPKISRKRHKYQAGLVVGLSGSSSMMGAAKLSSLACLRSGAGMVKIFFMAEKKTEEFPAEVISGSFLETEKIQEELKRAKAVYIGPGIGREKKVLAFLEKILVLIKVPLVVDADALFFLAQTKIKIPKNSILTPHKKEMERLLGKEYQIEREFFIDCQKYAEEKEVILLVKGAPSFIFYSGYKPFIAPFGDPGMATAGTGDVLTGIIAALLAQGMAFLQAVFLGATLHGIAGEISAREKSSYSLIASDLVENLPKAFQQLMLLTGLETLPLFQKRMN